MNNKQQTINALIRKLQAAKRDYAMTKAVYPEIAQQAVKNIHAIKRQLNIAQSERGQGLLAFAILLAFIAIVILALYYIFGGDMTFTQIWYKALCQVGSKWACNVNIQ